MVAKHDLRNTLAVGDELEVAPTGVAHGGVFVARDAGGVIFAPDTLPGERVRVRLMRVAKSFAHAETLEIVEAAPERVAHVWQEAGIERAPMERAGGAEFGHIALSHQRALKEQVIADAMLRIGGHERTAAVKAAPGDTESNGLGYRTRVRLHVDEYGRQGPYAARTNTVVPVASLPLASAGIQRDALLEERLPGASFVEYVELSDGTVEVVATEGAPSRGATQTIVERVGQREFRLDRAGFWQVHKRAPEVLTDAVRRAIDPALADPRAANLDLYGGVGIFAAVLGDLLGSGTRVTSVEGNEVATDHAAENLAEWVGASAITDRVDRYLAGLRKGASAAERARLRAGTVVLDPPRDGAGTQVVADLLDIAPAQIVYVACDPVALARDTKTLAAGGYRLDTFEAFDLFPHTHHVEAVAAFRRDS